jgi:hypothetical protein
LYNLFSTGINILPLNADSNETLSQINSLLQRSNMRNLFESAFSSSAPSSRQYNRTTSENENMDIYPEQPDVD